MFELIAHRLSDGHARGGACAANRAGRSIRRRKAPGIVAHGEGLDFPEVSLVAIRDAEKEGFRARFALRDRVRALEDERIARG